MTVPRQHRGPIFARRKARWNTDGAMCVDDPRLELPFPLPECIAERVDRQCARSPLGLIRTEAVAD